MSFCFLVLIFLIIYWTISIICFIFPIRKKQFIFKNPLYKQLLSNNNKAILDIAHRGGSQESFENTIKAFKHSKSLGINVLEMDVHLTKDKKLVVIHDTVLDRLCGVNKVVANYNFDTFPKYKDEIRLHFSSYLTVKNDQTKEEQLCLLDDVFKQFPNSLFNIELKDESQEGIQIFFETVTRNHIDDRIVNQKNNLIFEQIWGARHYQGTKKLRELAPHIPVFFSAEGVLKLFFCFFLGLLPFIELHYNSLQVPLFTKEFFIWKKKDSKNWFEYLLTLIMLIICFFYQFLLQSFGIIKLLNIALPFIITHLKKRGIITMLWVLNENEDFDKAVKMGAQGIMTDCPTLLKNYLGKKHLSID